MTIFPRVPMWYWCKNRVYVLRLLFVLYIWVLSIINFADASAKFRFFSLPELGFFEGSLQIQIPHNSVKTHRIEFRCQIKYYGEIKKKTPDSPGVLLAWETGLEPRLVKISHINPIYIDVYHISRYISTLRNWISLSCRLVSFSIGQPWNCLFSACLQAHRKRPLVTIHAVSFRSCAIEFRMQLSEVWDSAIQNETHDYEEWLEISRIRLKTN